MSEKKSAETKEKENALKWPWLLRIAPRTIITIILIWLAIAWLGVLAVDIYGWVDPGLDRPLWRLLFNDRPIEWTQWFLLVFAIAASGYLAGRLDSERRGKVARFFFLFAIGLGLMMIEDAGDIRHTLSREVERLFGSRILGFRHNFIVEVPYFAAIASVPLYALAKYGKYVWEYTRTRYYLIVGFVLYGMAAVGSALSNVAHSYVFIGALIDIALFGERLPTLEGRSQGFTYFLFTDSAVEESIELLAITAFVAALLAFAHTMRKKNRSASPVKS